MYKVRRIKSKIRIDFSKGVDSYSQIFVDRVLKRFEQGKITTDFRMTGSGEHTYPRSMIREKIIEKLEGKGFKVEIFETLITLK
jgi:hypothetical protein